MAEGADTHPVGSPLDLCRGEQSRTAFQSCKLGLRVGDGLLLNVLLFGGLL